MKKYLLLISAAVALAIVGVSCTPDPKDVDTGNVGIQQTSLTADGEGDDVVFDVVSDTGWYLEFSDPETGDRVRWITSNITQGKGDTEVMLTVARNPSNSERTALVNVVADSWMADASVLLTQGPGVGGGEGYSFPICEIFEVDENLLFSNGFIDGNVIAFDGGMTITRTGDNAGLTFVCPCHNVTKPVPQGFHRGVSAIFTAADQVFVIEIPVRDELSGSLRYLFGSRRDNTGGWELEWSGDGETWTEFTSAPAVGGSDPMWKSADFTIPESKKIAAGGKLTIRMTPTDYTKFSATALFQHGVSIVRSPAAPTTVPAADNTAVVFSHGFDDVAGAKAAPIDLPVGFMTSFNAGAYSMPTELSEFATASSCWSRPGFLQVGRGDESLTDRYTQGSYAITIGDRFAEMNILKSDLKLTFLASAMIDAYGEPTDPGVVVKAGGGGATVDNGGAIAGMANNEFREFTVYVRNATPETTITITSADMASSTDDVRFFIDDVLLEVEGEPERPTADTPVKADISAVRAMEGVSAVTVSENYYIQGRVVAVDNVPENCFAIADDDAGIFVKMSGHGLTAGDEARVMVKDAQLKVDADGLLVVTPTAADKLEKVAGTAQMPAAKAVTVAELKAGTYEAMYVSLPASQVVAADLAKTMSGDITLELADQTTTYTMKTYTGASFATATVPQLSGALKGIAGSSMLLPTSPADLAAMTSTRFGQAVYAIKPIAAYMTVLGTGTNLTLRNASYADKTITFSSPAGCSVTKLGGGVDDNCRWQMRSNSSNFYDSWFITNGWGGENWQENALLFKIKATSQIVGNLRFGFGLRPTSATQKVPKNWKVVWSNDNSTWNDDVKILTSPYTTPTDEFALSTSNGVYYRMATFNVPESKAVADGDYIYVKVMPVDNECLVVGQTVDPAAGEMIFDQGFYLTTHEKRAYHTSTLPSGGNVLLAEGFDESFLGHDNFLPCWQFMTSYASPFTMPEGWGVSGDIYQMPGYIRLGKSNTAITTITTPALAALGDTPTDITLKFKAAILLVGAAGYVPDNKTMTVEASVGTVKSQPDFSALPAANKNVTESVASSMEAAYHKWQEITIPVTGATKDTKISISHTGRHFIDDIVITRD